MGLLDSMARTAGPAGLPSAPPAVLTALPVGDWDREHKDVEVALGVRRESVGLDAVLAMPSNVWLVRREDAGADDLWYVVVDNHVQYSLSERDAGGWLRVLRQLDGRRTLREALDAAAAPEAEIRKYLEEAIDFGVLLRPDGAS